MNLLDKWVLSGKVLELVKYSVATINPSYDNNKVIWVIMLLPFGNNDALI